MRIDIYDCENKMIQNNMELDSVLETKDWLRTIQVLLYNEKFEFLICQNPPEGLYFSGKWDIGLYGSLQSGENPFDAGARICNEQLAIYVETGKLSFLTKHSEITVHTVEPPKLLKRHIQTLTCLVPNGLIDPDFIDYNVFQASSWLTLDTLADKILQRPDTFAYHPSHSIEPLERISYWGDILEKARKCIEDELDSYLQHDLESLSKSAHD